jgi:hypothetical protein
MWTPVGETLEGGRVRRIAVQRDGQALRVADAVELWQQDRAFRSFFMALLAEAPFAAYFWECPPVTAATAARSFEFVLVDSPHLAAVPPDPRAFASHLKADDDTATFWNLGRDALLVAPCPKVSPTAYTHLAAFARGAPTEQQHALWQAVGAAVAGHISAAPLWLSTSGLGVAWLHIRLDSRPKYYSYEPYRRSTA